MTHGPDDLVRKHTDRTQSQDAEALSSSHPTPAGGENPETDRAVAEGALLHDAPRDSLQVSEQLEMEQPVPPVYYRRRRRLRLPAILFLLTGLSTFLVGATFWSVPSLFFPTNDGFDGFMELRRMILVHWKDGLIYMAAVLGILLAHEMGHFVATVRHRIAASLPYFLPLPITPIGTLGAVIGMDGMRANRKQIFDIGIAGPLAGLVIAIPVLWAGVNQLDLTDNQFGMYQLDMPLGLRLMADLANIRSNGSPTVIWQGQLNPLLMAGWVGLLVTGLNMLPVSQLDGGHVVYSLFGRSSRWIARMFILSVVAYMVLYSTLQPIIMIGLILLIGVDHPPTSDDSVPLGWQRQLLGYLSLIIPVLCIPPRLLITPPIPGM